MLVAQTLAHGELPHQPKKGPQLELFDPHEATQPPLYYALVALPFLGSST